MFSYNPDTPRLNQGTVEAAPADCGRCIYIMFRAMSPDCQLSVRLWYFKVKVHMRLYAVEAICSKSGKQVHDEVVETRY